MDARQLLRYIASGDAPGEQGVRIQIDPHLALHAADAGDVGDAFHAVQRPCDVAVHEPRQRIRRHLRRRHRIGLQRAIDINLADHRFQDVLWQIAADAGDGIARIVQRHREIGLQIEFDEGRAEC